MNDQLYNYLTKKLPEEQIDILSFANEILTTVYGEDFSQQIDYMVTQPGFDENDITLNQIRDVHLLNIDKALKEFGVIIQDDQLMYENIKPLSEMLYALTEVEYYNGTILKGILELNEDNITTLSLILDEILQNIEYQYDEYIDTVSEDLILKISDILLNREEDTFLVEKDVVKEEINPRLIEMKQNGDLTKVNSWLIEQCVPNQLSIDSAIRYFGKRIADGKNKYDWIYLAYSSKGKVTLSTLIDKYTNCFIEDKDALDTSMWLNVYEQNQLNNKEV